MHTKQHLHLTDAQITALTALVSDGYLPAKVFRRATALLELARGTSLVEVARTLNTTNQTVAACPSHGSTQVGVASLMLYTARSSAVKSRSTRAHTD